MSCNNNKHNISGSPYSPPPSRRPPPPPLVTIGLDGIFAISSLAAAAVTAGEGTTAADREGNMNIYSIYRRLGFHIHSTL